jgi:hypothetical protein
VSSFAASLARLKNATTAFFNRLLGPRDSVRAVSRPRATFAWWLRSLSSSQASTDVSGLNQPIWVALRSSAWACRKVMGHSFRKNPTRKQGTDAASLHLRSAPSHRVLSFTEVVGRYHVESPANMAMTKDRSADFGELSRVELTAEASKPCHPSLGCRALTYAARTGSSARRQLANRGD